MQALPSSITTKLTLNYENMRAPRLFSFVLCAYFLVPFFLYFPQATTAISGGRRGVGGDGGSPVPVSDGPTVRRNERWTIESSEFGEISAVKISDGKNGCYLLHFITINPQALFLPAYLHSEMVLYVNSGRGSLSLINVEEDDKLQQVMLQRGDIYRLSPQTVFYLQNNGDSYDYQSLQPLEIYAIFPGSETELHTKQQLTGAYIGVHDLVLGFDNNVLQSTLGVPELVIEQLREGEGQQLIVDAGQADEASSTSMWDVGSWAGIRALQGTKNSEMIKLLDENKDKKAYNIFNKDRDVITCYGWSVTVTKKELHVLKNTDFGVFMVNLNTASMMGPHWNPNTAQVAVVLQGEGMLEVVCPSIASETGCQNLRFRVEEGDVFVVPKYHPMAQISFNNNSFVFMGFMLNSKKESTQYLTGKLSILQKIEKSVLAKSFNVNNMTIDQVLRGIQREKIFSECISCAEEEVERESEEGSGAGETGGRGGGARIPEEERGRGGWQEEGGQGGRRQEDERRGRGGWQEEGREGGIGRMEEEEMQRMKREVEEVVAARGIGVA